MLLLMKGAHLTSKGRREICRAFVTSTSTKKSKGDELEGEMLCDKYCTYYYMRNYKFYEFLKVIFNEFFPSKKLFILKFYAYFKCMKCNIKQKP